MAAVECPQCHRITTTNKTLCQWCGAYTAHCKTLLITGNGRGEKLTFLQWLESPPAKDSTKSQVILKWVIRVLLFAVAPIALVFAIFVSIAPILLVGFAAFCVYAMKIKD